MVKQAVPQQPMQDYDLDYTSGRLQQESLVAARLGKKGRSSLQGPKGLGVETAMDMPFKFLQTTI